MKPLDYIIIGLKEFFGRSKDPDRYPTETIWDALERALKEGYLSDEERIIFEKAKKDFIKMESELFSTQGALGAAEAKIDILMNDIDDLLDFIDLMEVEDTNV